MSREAQARRKAMMPVDRVVDLELRRQSNLWKQDPVRVVATTNITLSGRQTIDGVALTPGQWALVAGQTAGQDDGLYECRDLAWFRAELGDHSDMLRKGTTVYVSEGTTYGGTWWTLTTLNVVLGTTVQVWTPANGLRSYTTGGRPSAVVAGVGGTYYDTTLHKPGYSDGTNWRDAAGTII